MTSNSHEKVNILMVDDQPAKLLSYEVMLEELGEHLIKANSAKEALEHLLKVDVAVVLMDVSMPEFDGFELANMIRQHPRFQKTAIIFISAVHLTDLDRLKGYELGAVDYISVPVIPDLLRAKVRVFAELHRKTSQLEKLNRELERRVEDRTQELERRAEALQRLNLKLAHKNQELDAILHTAPDIIFSRHADGNRDYISDRFYEYTGAPSGSAHGAAWMDYVHPEDRDAAMVLWQRSVDSGANYEAEYRLRSGEGEYRWFRARAVPIRDDQANIVRWYGTCSDIHDSKLLEQSIRDSAIRLERMVDNRTAELRRLSVRLMTMQDQEHRRIARELHDGLGQELAVAKMVLDSAVQEKPLQSGKDACAEASRIVDRAIQQVRTMSHLLHPPLLDEVGLLSAITWYVDGLSDRSGIETSLDVQPQEFPRLPADMETAIFRIVQEALTNVFRHSDARRVWITLTQSNGKTLISVRDDGKGIGERVADLQPDSIGVGIGGIRQRTKEFGGEFRIANAKPGTLVEVLIPTTTPVLQEAMIAEGFD
ncbi:MAG TPA: PAS domain-containing protein [Verrucomicrobiae bacterium]|jgi:PAS domain S-box-containing protein|nr:PAS domain-containing protein [Verrucomicrobiae bacterium]